MIRTVRLTDYGMHRDREFWLNRITLVIGPNESGKTSLFDALCEALSSPDRRKRAEFAERYGEARRVTVDPELSDPPDIADVLRIAAVRADRLALPPHLYRPGLSRPEDAERDWATELRTSLLSSGVDPASLSVELQRSATSRALGTPGKRLKDARNQLDSLSADISRMESGLASLETRRTESETARDTRIAAEAEASRATSALEAAEEELRQAEAAAELARLKDQYRILDEWSRTTVPPESLPTPADLQRLRAERDAAREQRDSERSRLDTVPEGENAQALDGTLAELSRLSEQAEQIHLGGKARRGVQPALLALALVVAGIPLSLLVLPDPWRWFAANSVLGAAGLLWLGLRALRLSRTRKEAEKQAKRIARRLQTLVTAAKPALLTSLADTPEIPRVQQDIADVQRVLTRERENAEQQAQERERVSAAVTAAEAEYGLAQERLERCIREAVAASEAHLETLVYQAESARGVASELAERARPILAGLEAESPGAALAELRRRIADAEDDHPGPAPSDATLRALRASVARLADDKNMAERSLYASREHEARVSTSVEERSGTVPDELRAAYSRARELREDAADAELELKGMQLAAEVLGRIGGEDERELVRLVDDVSWRYGRVTGSTRAIRLEGIRFSEAVAVDAAGVERPVGSLSQSTRAALYLGIRLELAERVFAGRIPLLLDEPFVHMDEDRAAQTAEMLVEWVMEGDRQLIVFSARPETARLFNGASGLSSIALDQAGAQG